MTIEEILVSELGVDNHKIIKDLAKAIEQYVKEECNKAVDIALKAGETVAELKKGIE